MRATPIARVTAAYRAAGLVAPTRRAHRHARAALIGALARRQARISGRSLEEHLEKSLSRGFPRSGEPFHKVAPVAREDLGPSASCESSNGQSPHTNLCSTLSERLSQSLSPPKTPLPRPSYTAANSQLHATSAQNAPLFDARNGKSEQAAALRRDTRRQLTHVRAPIASFVHCEPEQAL